MRDSLSDNGHKPNECTCLSVFSNTRRAVINMRRIATERELIELVVDPANPAEATIELRSLRGLEDLVACVLDSKACDKEPNSQVRPLAA